MPEFSAVVVAAAADIADTVGTGTAEDIAAAANVVVDIAALCEAADIPDGIDHGLAQYLFLYIYNTLF